MYNAPRAATVTATSSAIVWVVDRFTFNRIARNLGKAKIQQFADFLRHIDILAPLTEFERVKIAEALDEVGSSLCSACARAPVSIERPHAHAQFGICM